MKKYHSLLLILAVLNSASLQAQDNKKVFSIYFKTGVTQLDSEAQKTIDSVAVFLRDLKGYSIKLSGHADSRGDENLNLKLSEKAASTVEKAVVAKNVAADSRRRMVRSART